VQREREALQRADGGRRRQRPDRGLGLALLGREGAPARYAIDDAEVKPYFRLEAMVQAAFDCASRLFGLRFVRATTCRSTTPTSRPTRCSDAHGRPVGLFLQDNFARAQQAQRRLDEFAALAPQAATNAPRRGQAGTGR
jgi:peptidyl-dipeptidase Dcp